MTPAMNSSPRPPTLETPSALLPKEPPPFVVRSIAWLLIALFAAVVLAACLIPVPETVRCEFILVPRDGADPIQAPYQAVVQTVHVEQGQEVAAGEELFVLRSDEVRLRHTKRQTLREDLQSRIETSEKMEANHLALLDIKAAELVQIERELEFRLRHTSTNRELVGKLKKLASSGVISQFELTRQELALAESEKDSHVAQKSVETARLERLRLETERARQRAEDHADVKKFRHELEALDRSLGSAVDDLLTIRAPYAAVVTSVAQRTPGNVVAPGAELCQLARLEATPHAQLLIREAGLPRLAPGQRIRLFFDAYPYQRYGTVGGELGWISPAAITRDGGQRFVAIGILDHPHITAQGQERPLRVGMQGQARIGVGSRTLIESAFQPLRQLRENLRHD